MPRRRRWCKTHCCIVKYKSGAGVKHTCRRPGLGVAAARGREGGPAAAGAPAPQHQGGRETKVYSSPGGRGRGTPTERQGANSGRERPCPAGASASRASHTWARSQSPVRESPKGGTPAVRAPRTKPINPLYSQMSRGPAPSSRSRDTAGPGISPESTDRLSLLLHGLAAL